MNISQNQIIALFFVYIICFCGGYVFLRNILWSIVWCDKKGKYNSLKKLKEGKSLFELINMKFLEKHTNKHKRNFKFWMLIKRIYSISQLFLAVTYIALWFVWQNNIHCEVFMFLIVFQAAIVSLVFMFQADVNRNTKYDRIRQKAKGTKKDSNS